MCTFFQETKIDSGITQDGENLEAVATTPIEEPLNTSKMSLISDLKPNTKKPRDEACNLEVPMSSVASEITVEKIENRMNDCICNLPDGHAYLTGTCFQIILPRGPKGFGIKIGGSHVIQEVAKDSFANQAIFKGDFVSMVDDISTKGLSRTEFKAHMTAAKHSVRLTIHRLRCK